MSELSLFDPAPFTLAVRDEDSFECLGCGVDTREIAEYYMLTDPIWLSVNADVYGMLCIGCVEARLGRELRPIDFIDAPVNRSREYRRSDRLRDRLGFSNVGEQAA